MPTIRANLNSWDKDWGHDGDRWSQAWGSTEIMWNGSLWPRVCDHLPTGRLLEIAPGRGRVTAKLLPHCDDYIGIDLAPACVEACRARFGDVSHARFETTDGRSLPHVDDDSIDFAFSWDSLVHVEQEVLDGYLAELRRVLRPGGTAFLHHSNVATFVGDDGELTIENPHWRDPTASAENVRARCAQLGLHCVAQELIQWGVEARTDCLTVLRRPAASDEVPPATRVREHPNMNAEMAHFRELGEHYGS